jgi:predicted GIY-YIG superfamily endonuclease
MPPVKKSSAWHVYVACCADGTLYTGITNDLKARLECHNSGKASKYTRVRLPIQFVHTEACRTRGKALSREAAIKKLSRSEKHALFSPKSVA